MDLGISLVEAPFNHRYLFRKINSWIDKELCLPSYDQIYIRNQKKQHFVKIMSIFMTQLSDLIFHCQNQTSLVMFTSILVYHYLSSCGALITALHVSVSTEVGSAQSWEIGKFKNLNQDRAVQKAIIMHAKSVNSVSHPLWISHACSETNRVI